MDTIPKSPFAFLKKLSKNNNRDCMAQHKKEYQTNEKLLKAFYSDIITGLNEDD